jgi:hypothetical protein
MPEHHLGLYLSILQLDVYKDYPKNITKILHHVHIIYIALKKKPNLKFSAV